MRAETRQARLSPVLWGLAVLFVLPAVAGAQLTHYEITDGPGKGEVIAAGPENQAEEEPVDKGNNPINNAKGHVSEPDGGCNCNHYHGSLNGKGDPRATGTRHPLGCGWGCVRVVDEKSKPSTRIISARLYEARARKEFEGAFFNDARLELGRGQKELKDLHKTRVFKGACLRVLNQIIEWDAKAADRIITARKAQDRLVNNDKVKRTFAAFLAKRKM